MLILRELQSMDINNDIVYKQQTKIIKIDLKCINNHRQIVHFAYMFFI